MNHIFSTSISQTTDWLIDNFGHAKYQNHFIEAWVFADKEQRQNTERALLNLGITAKLRSAYKPLVHFFIEDMSLHSDQITHVEIEYPLHHKAPEKRFLLEAYPLPALLGDIQTDFTPNSELLDSYKVTLYLVTGEEMEHTIFAPNRLHSDWINQEHLSPTGWLKVTDINNQLIQNERLLTDYETLFIESMEAITHHPWEGKAPYFNELNIQVLLPWRDQTLGYRHEVLSLSEALHEDFYFSLQEWFKVKSGYGPHDRKGQPGQIVPEIQHTEQSHLSIKIETRDYVREETIGVQTLATAETPISIEQISKELHDIEGLSFSVNTVAGNPVTARYREGVDAPVIISGGQHANETTGVIGSLRAAKQLNQQEQSHFIISPLENPDGYALHQRLIQHNPLHMHHAARYTALGDDLEYRTNEPYYEKQIRHTARELSKASLHINLHGYPSHEWTRPLSGYVPHGFDMWTIPKGFFLMLRHHPDPKWALYAEEFIHLVTLKLIGIPGLLAFNNEQIKLYEKHAGKAEFRMVNGLPCLVSQGSHDDIPIQLITEYPDESIYGEDFIFGHSVQTETVLAAYNVHQQLSATATAHTPLKKVNECMTIS